jgi:hypothetical protein
MPALRKLLSGGNPYSIKGFYNPPWLLFILMPLMWIPWYGAMILPMIALTLAAHKRQKWWLIPIVGLSVPFLAQTIYANVDWLPLLGIAYGGASMPLLVTVKPQSAGMVVVTYLHRKRLIYFIPLIVAVIISFILVPDWISWMLKGGKLSQKGRNLSLFPYSIPVGLVALWLAWKREDALWGTVASLSLSPYFFIHSLLPFIFLLTDRRWWWGLIASALTWGILVLSMVGVLHLDF